LAFKGLNLSITLGFAILLVPRSEGVLNHCAPSTHSQVYEDPKPATYEELHLVLSFQSVLLEIFCD